MRKLQDLLDHQGFIVIAYSDPDDLAADDKTGLAAGDIEGDLEGSTVKIIGTATREEWLKQCAFYGDPDFYALDDYIAFRKVIAE